MNQPSRSPEVIFAMLTFKPLDGADLGKEFFRLISDYGAGILDPQLVNERVRFDPAHIDRVAGLWQQDKAISLDRKSPYKMSGLATIVDESIRTLVPSSLYFSIDARYFDVPNRLLALIASGDALYSILSACFGAIYTSWTPLRGVLADVDRRGLPGVGWGTWLGPEYSELIQVTTCAEYEVVRLPDGGTRIVLPLPDKIDAPSQLVLRSYETLLQRIGEDVLQVPRGPVQRMSLLDAVENSRKRERIAVQRSVRVPKFRFQEERK